MEINDYIRIYNQSNQIVGFIPHDVPIKRDHLQMQIGNVTFDLRTITIEQSDHPVVNTITEWIKEVKNDLEWQYNDALDSICLYLLFYKIKIKEICAFVPQDRRLLWEHLLHNGYTYLIDGGGFTYATRSIMASKSFFRTKILFKRYCADINTKVDLDLLRDLVAFIQHNRK